MFPVRYKLNLYINLLRNSVFKDFIFHTRVFKRSARVVSLSIKESTTMGQLQSRLPKNHATPCKNAIFTQKNKKYKVMYCIIVT
jgi:hypothetical protein